MCTCRDVGFATAQPRWAVFCPTTYSGKQFCTTVSDTANGRRDRKVAKAVANPLPYCVWRHGMITGRRKAWHLRVASSRRFHQNPFQRVACCGIVSFSGIFSGEPKRTFPGGLEGKSYLHGRCVDVSMGLVIVANFENAVKALDYTWSRLHLAPRHVVPRGDCLRRRLPLRLLLPPHRGRAPRADAGAHRDARRAARANGHAVAAL